MRVFGWLSFMLGLTVLLFSCAYDVTVQTADGRSVPNLHKISTQASLERWGFGLSILGVVAIGVGRRTRTPREKDDPNRYPPA
jgi:hypothetical protein